MNSPNIVGSMEREFEKLQQVVADLTSVRSTLPCDQRTEISVLIGRFEAAITEAQESLRTRRIGGRRPDQVPPIIIPRPAASDPSASP